MKKLKLFTGIFLLLQAVVSLIVILNKRKGSGPLLDGGELFCEKDESFEISCSVYR